jgi:hypothetical protein
LLLILLLALAACSSGGTTETGTGSEEEVQATEAPAAEEEAEALLKAEAMPLKAAIDAAHVAIATTHGLDFVLTWNCTHIANATMRPRIEAVCHDYGFRPPIICTPEELTLEEET